MNIEKFRPQNETEDKILSITANGETLFEQTLTKAQETRQFELLQSRESFSFTPSNDLGLDSKWMAALTSLEFCNSKSFIKEGNYKIELYTDFLIVLFSRIKQLA